MSASEILDLTVYGSTLLQWALAAGMATIIVLLVGLAKPVLLRRLGAAAQRTRLSFDDALVYALRATRLLPVALIAIGVGGQLLDLPAKAEKFVGGAATIALFVQVGLWVAALMEFWMKKTQGHARAASAGTVTSLSAVGFAGRIVLWTVVLLLILDNLGINITTLIAGLGIGGIAVALAVQNVLGDLFASLSIVIDKPFVVGDFIIVDNYMGSVENIGLKTTRMRSLDGEEIVFSNSDLLKTRLRNYKRMYERRIVFPFRIRYTATPQQLEQIPGLVQRLIESHKNTRFERSHFFRFGEASFDFETVFWILTPDYNVYMDIQQDINLRLMRELQQRGIEFALPTQLTELAGDGRAGDGGPQAEGAPAVTRQ